MPRVSRLMSFPFRITEMLMLSVFERLSTVITYPLSNASGRSNECLFPSYSTTAFALLSDGVYVKIPLPSWLTEKSDKTVPSLPMTFPVA